ncbi:hypothetical protein B0H10DRAFT_2213454 [Mycena sp. CBHHK59/15]|nr:hypothetical protein B0H10DRAFT_2213454 [Mycena sp. CBHHK59/15]
MPPSSPSFAPSFQIIVVPPAEDFAPDYLVFDADDLPEPDLATPPDFLSLDAALSQLDRPHPPPQFNRTSVDTVVMPKRSDPHPDLADQTVHDDSEIVEVVKVRRTHSPEPPPPAPKPKSLRSRASKAFRSIKNVARASSRTRPYAQDTFASSQSTHPTIASASAAPPPLTRRGSVILSQLFRSPSATDVAAPSSTLDFLNPDLYSDDDDDEPDEPPIPAPRASSPSPSTRTFSSTVRRRLSILNFQRRPRAAAPSPPSPPSLSRGSTLPSDSSSAPQTPTDEAYPRPLPTSKDADDPDVTLGEMRLDSLHFDSLSFDPDNF